MLVTRSGLNDRVVEFEGQLIKSAPNGTVEVATDTIETLRATPADGDIVGRLGMKGNNDATAVEKIQYGAIEVVSTDVSDGTEDGAVVIKAMAGGVETEVARFDGNQGVTLFDDFLAAAIDGRWSSTAGAGGWRHEH